MTRDRDDSPYLDMLARLLLLLFACGFGMLAWAYKSSGSGFLFWLAGLFAILCAYIAIFGPRRWRVGLIEFLPWL